MANEQERFILYEYLQFFWKKKWWFIVIPVILAAVTMVGFLLQEREYEGVGTVYVGDLTGPLTDPEYLVAILDENGDTEKDKGNVKTNYDGFFDLDKISSYRVYVSGKDKMTFEVVGPDRKEVEKQLKTLVQTYKSELDEKAKQRIEFTEGQVKALEEDVKKLEAVVSELNGVFSADEQAILAEALSQNLQARLDIEEKKKDIEFFDYPQILEQSVDEKSKFVIEAGFVAVVVGLLLTVLFLMLWKYIQEAKRHG